MRPFRPTGGVLTAKVAIVWRNPNSQKTRLKTVC